MTWKEFVAKVEAQLAERQVPDDAPLTSVNWGDDPYLQGVFVNVMRDEQGRIESINVTED